MKILAIVLPLLAVLLCGKPVRALLTVPLCVIGWLSRCDLCVVNSQRDSG